MGYVGLRAVLIAHVAPNKGVGDVALAIVVVEHGVCCGLVAGEGAVHDVELRVNKARYALCEVGADGPALAHRLVVDEKRVDGMERCISIADARKEDGPTAGRLVFGRGDIANGASPAVAGED